MGDYIFKFVVAFSQFSENLNLSEDLNKTTQIFFAQLQPAGYFEPWKNLLVKTFRDQLITFTYLSHTTEGRNCNLLLEIVTKLMYDISLFKTTYFKIISLLTLLEDGQIWQCLAICAFFTFSSQLLLKAKHYQTTYSAHPYKCCAVYVPQSWIMIKIFIDWKMYLFIRLIEKCLTIFTKQ